MPQRAAEFPLIVSDRTKSRAFRGYRRKKAGQRFACNRTANGYQTSQR